MVIGYAFCDKNTRQIYTRKCSFINIHDCHDCDMEIIDMGAI